MIRRSAHQTSVCLILFVLSACDTPKRPSADGDVGAVYVYGQTATGATRLLPEKLATLNRPQRFSFELNVAGTGPRSIHIEIHTPDRTWRMFNERVQAPKTNWYFDFVLTTDERLPPRFDIVTRVDAPHTKAVTSRFPIRLRRTGPSTKEARQTSTSTRINP